MSSLILPRRFTSQPQYPVEIDATFPFAHSLRQAFNCASGIPYDAVSGKALTPVTASQGVVAGPAGVAKKYVATTASMDIGSEFNTPFVDSPDGYTTLCLLRTTSTANGAYHYSIGGNGGINYAGLRGAGAATSIQAAGGGGNNTVFSGVPNWCDGGAHIIAICVWGINDRRVYIDGVLVGQNTHSLSPAAGYTYYGFGGLNRNSAELPIATELLGLQAYAGVLPEALLKELSTPHGFWQIFRAPKRVLYFDVSTPGIPTLSLPGVDQITTTGARPYVSLGF